MQQYDVVIIGGGPAGLAAAIAAKQEGIHNIIIIEREGYLGGILNQCIHSGFGEKSFNEELTGPEFAQRLIERLHTLNISYKLNTMVLDVSDDRIITAVNKDEAVIKVKARTIIMAMGCRERPRGAASMPGNKYAGVFTVGTAQRFVNIEGYLPGKEIVILGSGDIGLIMARRLTIEGARVKAVVEAMPYATGSRRNVIECVEDFNIPLKLSHSIVDVKGRERVEGVTIAKVDENKKIVKDTEMFIPCDTLLLSVDLIPESEIPGKAGARISKASYGPEVNESLETSIEGLFACGNLLHVHDMVDDVVLEGTNAGINAAAYVRGRIFAGKRIDIMTDEGIKYVVPQTVNPQNIQDFFDLKFRVNSAYINSFISVYFDEVRELFIKKDMLVPGELEVLRLDKNVFNKYPLCKKIKIAVEKQ